MYDWWTEILQIHLSHWTQSVNNCTKLLGLSSAKGQAEQCKKSPMARGSELGGFVQQNFNLSFIFAREEKYCQRDWRKATVELSVCILVNLGSWLQDLLMSEHGVPFLLFLAVEHVVVTLDYVIMPDMLLNASKGWLLLWKMILTFLDGFPNSSISLPSLDEGKVMFDFYSWLDKIYLKSKYSLLYKDKSNVIWIIATSEVLSGA